MNSSVKNLKICDRFFQSVLRVPTCWIAASRYEYHGVYIVIIDTRATEKIFVDQNGIRTSQGENEAFDDWRFCPS